MQRKRFPTKSEQLGATIQTDLDIPLPTCRSCQLRFTARRRATSQAGKCVGELPLVNRGAPRYGCSRTSTRLETGFRCDGQSQGRVLSGVLSSRWANEPTTQQQLSMIKMDVCMYNVNADLRYNDLNMRSLRFVTSSHFGHEAGQRQAFVLVFCR